MFQPDGTPVCGRGEEPRNSDRDDATARDIVVGVPAYNEAETVAEVVGGALAVTDSVVVVDDGSEDGTSRAARKAGAAVVEHDDNRGYGAALSTLFDEAVRRSPDHLVVVDADGQHDVSDVPRLVERQREVDAQIVIGSRFVEGSSTDASLYRRLGILVVNVLVNLSLGRAAGSPWLNDTQSGFRAYDPRAIRTFAASERLDECMGASLDLLYVAADNDFIVEEVSTDVRYEVPEANSQNPIAHGVSLVGNVVRNTLRLQS